jgi:hypothetical protein
MLCLVITEDSMPLKLREQGNGRREGHERILQFGHQTPLGMRAAMNTKQN